MTLADDPEMQAAALAGILLRSPLDRPEELARAVLIAITPAVEARERLAVEAEREACAKITDAIGKQWENEVDTGLSKGKRGHDDATHSFMARHGATKAAKDIRARSSTP